MNARLSRKQPRGGLVVPQQLTKANLVLPLTDVTTIFKYANLIYEPQLGVRLVVGQIYLDNQGCANSIFDDLTRLRKWNKPSKQGLWHRFDTCSGGGVAYLGAICSDEYGAGVSYDISGGRTWLWFAHEVGRKYLMTTLPSRHAACLTSSY